MKDYYTCFPESIEGINISSACENHDQNVGMRGTYCPITPHILFYIDLRRGGVSRHMSTIIALGGAILTWVRQPWFWYKIYKYRKKIGV